jgi:phosphatidylglycerophosphate synthase
VTVYDLKPKFQAILQPIADYLADRGITPNQVTIAALVLSIAEGALILLYPHSSVPLILLPFVLFVRMALNAIDGMIARQRNLQTTFGRQLNEYGDIVSDLALYAPFIFVLQSTFAILFLLTFLVGLTLSELIGIKAEDTTGVRRYDGPLGKSDRAIWMSLFAIAIAYAGEEVSTAVFMFMFAAASFVTCYNRTQPALIKR